MRRRLKYCSNKDLSKTPKQIMACCILHNFVQRAEQEARDAPVLAARRDLGASTPAPPAFDERTATSRIFPAAAQQTEDTLAHARVLRLAIAKECVEVRTRRHADAYRRRVKTPAQQGEWIAAVRAQIARAEAADRLAAPCAAANGAASSADE